MWVLFFLEAEGETSNLNMPFLIFLHLLNQLYWECLRLNSNHFLQ
jgi:hypothetical protein